MEIQPVKKKDYYVTLTGGNCSIVRSSSEQLAKVFSFRLFGAILSPYIQEATSAQVSWVKAMGGEIHEID